MSINIEASPVEYKFILSDLTNSDSLIIPTKEPAILMNKKINSAVYLVMYS